MTNVLQLLVLWWVVDLGVSLLVAVLHPAGVIRSKDDRGLR